MSAGKSSCHSVEGHLARSNSSPPAARVSLDAKKWRFITGRGQRLPGAKTDEHASRHGLHLESAICLLTEIVSTMILGGLSCRAQSALAYADRRIESGERRLDVVEFVAVAKALKVILLRSLLSGDQGIVDPRPARRAQILAVGRGRIR